MTLVLRRKQMGLAVVKKTTQGVELESFDGLLRGMTSKKIE